MLSLNGPWELYPLMYELIPKSWAIEFVVVDISSPYNAIVDRVWL